MINLSANTSCRMFKLPASFFAVSSDAGARPELINTFAALAISPHLTNRSAAFSTPLLVGSFEG